MYVLSSPTNSDKMSKWGIYTPIYFVRHFLGAANHTLAPFLLTEINLDYGIGK